MNQMLGEIKLIPYNDVPVRWLRCSGQALHINKYPKLYMLLGTKFGKGGEFEFKLPDLTKAAPKGLTYCIATEGELPKIHVENVVRKNKENDKAVVKVRRGDCRTVPVTQQKQYQRI